MQEEKNLRYVTSFERLAMEEGIEKRREEGRDEALRHGIRVALALNFGEQGTQLVREIDALEDTPTRQRILDGIESAKTVDDVREIWL